MALRVAVASGNWSNSATWYLGVKPTAGDIVAANGFTVTIDENINVDSLTNTTANPVSIIPLMTGATTPSGTVVASSQEPSTYVAWKAFDGNTAQFNSWNNNRSYTGVETLEYQFPTARIIVAYTVQTVAFPFPTAWQFQAWDGSAWVVLDSVTGAASTVGRTFTNTIAYTRYRIAISAPTTSFYLGELRMFDVAADAVFASAGGGFIANSTVTITCTSTTGITGGSTTPPLTVSAASPAIVTVNSNLTSFAVDNSRVILKTGNCTLNVTGSTFIPTSGSGRHCLDIAAAGTTNFIGNVRGAWSGSLGIRLTTGSTGAVLNITGNINPDKQIFNAQNATCVLVATVCTVNITGEIYGDFGNSVSINVTAAATINMTGNIYGGQAAGTSTGGAAISSGVGSYINIIGIVSAQHTLANSAPALVSTSSSAINLLTGPFVCSPEGFFPYQVVRMHLIPTTSSYFEFRDETTNGAGSPAPAAPATRLVSPATLISNLATSDVRFGVVYALGTLTGTLRMPTANQVTFGVAVDNTFGASVLTAASIWDYLVSNITTADSIGMRLKNVSTPQTTGEQLEAFLRLD